MTTIKDSIETDVSVNAAYQQWTQFEEFPKFMDGIDSVEQIDDTHLHWEGDIGGQHHEWNAEIVEQVPDRKIAWKTVGGEGPAGVVEFEPLGQTKTLVKVEIAYDPDAMTEEVGSAVRIDSTVVKGDLRRFKQLVEHNEGGY